jgi:hypothetical protein
MERFVEKIKKNQAGCWEWTGATDNRGYGVFHFGAKGGTVKSYRFSYELFVGKIPPSYEIDHLCRNPLCVNPKHLEAVTHRENVLRGRSPCANHARKTHCKNGHEFSEDNIFYRKDRNGSTRLCKICLKEYEKMYNKKRQLRKLNLEEHK